MLVTGNIFCLTLSVACTTRSGYTGSMKDGLVLFAGICLVFGIMIYAMVKFTQTQYAAPEKSHNEVVKDYKDRQDYRKNMQDIERRRKDMMRMQKQRIRDMQRR